MKKTFYFIFAWLGVVVLAWLTANIGRNFYRIFFPRELGEGFFELFTPGIIEGFVFTYLFWLGLIFVPVFKQKWWRYALAPALVVFLPFILFWPIALLGVIFFSCGVGVGFLVLWMRKKFD